MTVVELGGGRTQPDAVIDSSVGLSQMALVGSQCEAGETLAFIHARNEGDWRRAQARFLAALEWDGPTMTPKVIRGVVGRPS
jgi:thymidine phosphorylase